MSRLVCRVVAFLHPTTLQINGVGAFMNKYRKYTDFKCSKCGDESRVRVDYKRKTTMCRSCINIKQTTGRQEYYQTRLYYCWNNMKQRCSHTKATGYEAYGGAGISVCAEWMDFKNFKKWAMLNGYSEALTIDRINGEGNYEPSNCRWATYSTQSRNTKRIHTTNKSGYRGVCAKGKKFRAYIQVDKRQTYLGVFGMAEEAAITRDRYVIENKLEHTLNFTVKELKEIIDTYKSKIRDLDE